MIADMSEKPSKLDGIKGCVFDAYGTLLDVGAAARGCEDALGDKVVPLAEIWRQKQLEYTWLRSLMDSYKDFWHVTGQALDYAMKKLDIENPALRARLMTLYFKLQAYDDAKPCLKALRDAGMKTAILSNASVSMLTSAAIHAGLQDHLDCVFSVDVLSIYKPHPSVYQLAVDGLHLAPEQICFVSSNAWDVAGAAKFGFQVVWLNRGTGQLDELDQTPKAIVSSLSEIPGLVLT